jgi:hypothetical protein
VVFAEKRRQKMDGKLKKAAVRYIRALVQALVVKLGRKMPDALTEYALVCGAVTPRDDKQ